jgi:hypothetical protein
MKQEQMHELPEFFYDEVYFGNYWADFKAARKALHRLRAPEATYHEKSKEICRQHAGYWASMIVAEADRAVFPPPKLSRSKDLVQKELGEHPLVQAWGVVAAALQENGIPTKEGFVEIQNEVSRLFPEALERGAIIYRQFANSPSVKPPRQLII